MRTGTVEEPLAALAFKVMNDPYVGKMTLVRIYAGKISQGQVVWHVREKARVRINRILRIRSDKYEGMDTIEAGEICALVGLKTVRTGDTLCSEGAQILLEKMEFPEPMVGYAIEAESQKDEKRLEMTLQKLLDEDPTLQLVTDPETQQLVLRGMGELHLEVVLERMRSEFELPLLVGKPQSCI